MGIKIIKIILFVSILLISSVNLIKAQGGGQGCACGYDGAGTSCWVCPADPPCTSNAQCGGSNLCCNGQCVGAGQCGGEVSCGGGNWGVNCPPNTIRGTTIVSQGCYRPTYCPGPGTAQAMGACCAWQNNPDECREVCQNGRCSNFCTEVPPSCLWNTLITYNCISTCSPSAPSIVSNPIPANGSVVTNTSVPLSWTPPIWGTGCPPNNRYAVYVGTTPTNLAQTTTVSTNSATFRGQSGVTYYWSIYPNNGSLSASSPAIWSFTINVPPAITTPWWQVKDGDVTASNGDILSHVPATYTFNLNGTGGFPGVPVYSGQLIYDIGILSSKNWSANTTTTQGRIFDYTYFKNLIPDSVVPTTNSALLTSAGFVQDGYEWFKITGDLSLNDIDFGNRKVILFVDNGNLTLNGKVNVTDGTGFFGVFVKGNILVKSTVTGAAALEGIYLSDGSFTSELAATQLHVRGSVASYGGVALQRNLADDSTAAELFEYAPDQILLFPKKLAYRRTKWAEIAP